MKWFTAVRGIIGAGAIVLAAQAGAAKAPHQVVLSHELDAARATQLADLVTRFNAQDKKYQVVIGTETEDAKTAPTMMVLDGEREDALLKSQKYRALYKVMAASGIKLGRTRGAAAIAAYTLDSRGRRIALPIGLHTPVLFLNRRAFQEVGLDPDAPPRTWKALQDALGKLFDAGYACPYTVSQPSWVMLDNASARNSVAVTQRAGRAESLSVNGMLQIRHVALMASWIRTRYMNLSSRGSEAESRFARGECAVIAAPSASWPTFNQTAGFEVGVSELPYYDDFPGGPGATLVDGASLWMAEGRKRNDYRAAASFVRFMLRPENQLAWQRGTGFLPLDTEGRIAVKADKQDLPSSLVARSQLGVGKEGKSSRVSDSAIPRRTAVRIILEEELDSVWADTKAAKQALDSAVARAAQAK